MKTDGSALDEKSSFMMLALFLINIEFFFFIIIFLYIQFTLFRTKNLQSPGTYISKRTWDPSQKAITK